MSIVLRNFVAASERSADELDAEMRREHEHRCAILCYDVQDLAEGVATLSRRFVTDVARWEANVKAAPMDEQPQLASLVFGWRELEHRLLALFEKTESLIRTIREWGYDVDGEEAFHTAWSEFKRDAEVVDPHEQEVAEITRVLGDRDAYFADASANTRRLTGRAIV